MMLTFYVRIEKHLSHKTILFPMPSFGTLHKGRPHGGGNHPESAKRRLHGLGSDKGEGVGVKNPENYAVFLYECFL